MNCKVFVSCYLLKCDVIVWYFILALYLYFFYSLIRWNNSAKCFSFFTVFLSVYMKIILFTCERHFLFNYFIIFINDCEINIAFLFPSFFNLCLKPLSQSYYKNTIMSLFLIFHIFLKFYKLLEELTTKCKLNYLPVNYTDKL